MQLFKRIENTEQRLLYFNVGIEDLLCFSESIQKRTFIKIVKFYLYHQCNTIIIRLPQHKEGKTWEVDNKVLSLQLEKLKKFFARSKNKIKMVFINASENYSEAIYKIHQKLSCIAEIKYFQSLSSAENWLIENQKIRKLPYLFN
ncbi:MAG: hypothetical protein EAZ55_05275 [Cytophagales bacterium]|nr:MAG: hypothetical protein EAZ55_05275 [Cytophagales bacterium]